LRRTYTHTKDIVYARLAPHIIQELENRKLKDIVVDDRLYASAVHSLLNVLHGFGDKPERVMLFGHNPELTEFAHPHAGVPLPSLRSVRSRGETSARPTSQVWRSTIQRKRNRRATHRLSDEGDDAFGWLTCPGNRLFQIADLTERFCLACD
jgi:phosphohistidine phosphatase SixA